MNFNTGLLKEDYLTRIIEMLSDSNRNEGQFKQLKEAYFDSGLTKEDCVKHLIKVMKDPSLKDEQFKQFQKAYFSTDLLKEDYSAQILRKLSKSENWNKEEVEQLLEDYFDSDLLKKHYWTQYNEMSGYSNWNEEKDEKLKEAYNSAQRMHILGSTYGFISRKNIEFVQFMKKFGGDNEKIKVAVLHALKVCLGILDIALRTRRYLSVDAISEYIAGLKDRMDYWMKNYNFRFSVELFVQLLNLEYLIPVHARVQNKEKKIYGLLSKFGNGEDIEESKQTIFDLFDEYTDEVEKRD